MPQKKAPSAAGIHARRLAPGMRAPPAGLPPACRRPAGKGVVTGARRALPRIPSGILVLADDAARACGRHLPAPSSAPRQAGPSGLRLLCLGIAGPGALHRVLRAPRHNGRDRPLNQG